MIDSFSVSLWLTDAVLLGLAYLVGRVHGRFVERELYSKSLGYLIDEVKLLRKKVDYLQWTTMPNANP